MSKPSRPFGTRGGGAGQKPPKTHTPAAMRETMPGAAGAIAAGDGDDELAPRATVTEAMRTRKRSLGVTLVTMGALAAGGLALAERRQPVCVDDPATPTIDESLPENCRLQNRTSSVRHSYGVWGWHWRSSSGGPSRSWFSGGSSSSPSALHTTSSGSWGASGASGGAASHSTTSRGGFGSSGSFHFSGGS